MRIHWAVADARYLPFPAASFDNVYSYSVFQHLSKVNAKRAVEEAARVMKTGGHLKIQMPTRYGVRCLYHQIKRGFREPRGFEVRYWAFPELRQMFEEAGCDARFSVDCYFGIGIQHADMALMGPVGKAVVWASESLKRASHLVPALTRLADSVFVDCIKFSTSVPTN
jgi:SAM-dependent methyltransferase